MNRVNRRWLSPLALWSGILAGPIAWAIDLMASYALVKPSCLGQNMTVLRSVTAGALALVSLGALMSFEALRLTRADLPTDGGRPTQRAHFMAVLGIASNGLFALAIVALAIPRWVLDACH